MLVLDGWDEKHLTGLQKIGGRDLSDPENPTKVGRELRIDAEQVYRVEGSVEVDGTKVRIEVKGLGATGSLIDWRGESESLSIDAVWAPQPKTLYWAVPNGGAITILNGRIRMLSGEAKFLRPVADKVKSAGSSVEPSKIEPDPKSPLLRGHEGPVRRIHFLPDGKQVISVAWDGTARLWNLETGEQVRKFDGDKTLNNIALSPDGQRLAIGGSNFRVYLFDVSTGTRERVIQVKDHASMAGMAFSTDGKSLFVGNGPGVLHEFKASDGTPLPTNKVCERAISVIVPLPDNQRLLVAATGEKDFVLWNRDTREVEQRFSWTETFQGVRSLALFADGERIASAHETNRVRVWSLKTGQELKRWQAPPTRALPRPVCSPCPTTTGS
jgi:WD40 repeat protein